MTDSMLVKRLRNNQTFSPNDTVTDKSACWRPVCWQDRWYCRYLSI